MKAKVLIEFIDKATNQKHKVGEIITLSADRFNEICKAGHYVDAYEEPAKAEKK